MRFLSILKCGLRFWAAVFGFSQNLNVAFGFSKPLGLRFIAIFISDIRFFDAVFGFCSILITASGILKCCVRFLERKRCIATVRRCQMGTCRALNSFTY